MNLEQFYKDLFEWVSGINQQANQMTPEEWWTYIFGSAAEFDDRYKSHPLARRVILTHIDYLEEQYEKSETNG